MSDDSAKSARSQAAAAVLGLVLVAAQPFVLLGLVLLERSLFQSGTLADLYTSAGMRGRAPILIFVVLTLSLAALPWIPRRFTLRTLLIGTTFVAVVLGLVVWTSS